MCVYMRIFIYAVYLDIKLKNNNYLIITQHKKKKKKKKKTKLKRLETCFRFSN